MNPFSRGSKAVSCRGLFLDKKTSQVCYIVFHEQIAEPETKPAGSISSGPENARLTKTDTWAFLDQKTWFAYFKGGDRANQSEGP